jgi:hypothetical protein
MHVYQGCQIARSVCVCVCLCVVVCVCVCTEAVWYQDGMFNVAMTSALAAANNGVGGLKCGSYPLAFRPGMAALMRPDL